MDRQTNGQIAASLTATYAISVAGGIITQKFNNHFFGSPYITLITPTYIKLRSVDL